jgi:hypothetical protein
MTISTVARAGALAAAALMASLTGAPAQEGVFMKDLLGSMGIIPKEKPPIEYRERAPLVLPPRMELREPTQRTAVQANPQWPNDPDVLAERRRQAEENMPVTQTERRRLEQNPTLSIHEIRAGRRPGAEIPTAPVVRRGDNQKDDFWVHPDRLRAEGKKDDDTVLQVGVEPERRELTQPPTGLRTATMPLKRDFEAPNHRDDEADPKVYLREQAARR